MTKREIAEELVIEFVEISNEVRKYNSEIPQLNAEKLMTSFDDSKADMMIAAMKNSIEQAKAQLVQYRKTDIRTDRFEKITRIFCKVGKGFSGEQLQKDNKGYVTILRGRYFEVIENGETKYFQWIPGKSILNEVSKEAVLKNI